MTLNLALKGGGSDMEKSNTAVSVRIRDLVRYYLRLGTLGFGGPVALCGQMEKELVQERRWLSKEEMRDGIAVCQSLPGPLAIQVGIFISYLRGGFWGGVGRRVGLHPAQLHYRVGARWLVRPLQRTPDPDFHLLRRES